jgi:hypothetical protein
MLPVCAAVASPTRRDAARRLATDEEPVSTRAGITARPTTVEQQVEHVYHTLEQIESPDDPGAQTSTARPSRLVESARRQTAAGSRRPPAPVTETMIASTIRLSTQMMIVAQT